MLRPNRTAPPSRPGSRRPNDDTLNVLDRITDISFDPDEGRNFLFYGDSGTGKTTLWSSFPGPILVMICSGGRKPGELLSISKKDRAKIQTVTLSKPSEMDEIIRAHEAGTLRHGPTGKPYACMVLDHVTGFQDLKQQTIKNWNEIPQQRGFADTTQQEWGEISRQVKEHLAKLLSIRCNVVIIAQERIFLPGNDDKAKSIKASMEDAGVLKPKVGAALMPGITGWLNPACDYVVQTFIRQREIVEEHIDTHKGKELKSYETKKTPGVQFCARLGKHETFMTKFRVPGVKLPETIVLGDTIDGVVKSPSAYEQLMKYINSTEE